MKGEQTFTQLIQHQLHNRAILFTTYDLIGTCFPIKTLEVKCSRRIYIRTRLCAASAGAVINWVARGQRPQPPVRDVGWFRFPQPHPPPRLRETHGSFRELILGRKSLRDKCLLADAGVHLKGINLELLEP